MWRCVRQVTRTKRPFRRFAPLQLRNPISIHPFYLSLADVDNGAPCWTDFPLRRAASSSATANTAEAEPKYQPLEQDIKEGPSMEELLLVEADPQNLVEECLISTNWLLFRTRSWNASILHWREARNMTKWWVESSLAKEEKKKKKKRQNHDVRVYGHDAWSIHRRSPTRVVMSLMERAIHEQQQQQHLRSEKEANSGEYDENGDHFPLFWDYPDVVTRLIIDLWKRETDESAKVHGQDGESQQQQQPNSLKLSETVASSHLLQSPGFSRVPTLEEMKEWITTYGPSLPELSSRTWNTCLDPNLQIEESNKTEPQWNELLGSPKDAAEIRLSSAAKEFKDQYVNGVPEGTGVRDINYALWLVNQEDFCENHHFYLHCLRTLWENSPPVPNQATYSYVMWGVYLARKQAGEYRRTRGFMLGRPKPGTGLILLNLYQHFVQNYPLIPIPNDLELDQIRACRDLLRLVLEAMNAEEGGAYGKQAWKLWDDNLTRFNHFEEPSTPPDQHIAGCVLGILARTDTSEVPDIAEKAKSIIQIVPAVMLKEKDFENAAMNSYTFEIINEGVTWRFWHSYLECLVKDPEDSSSFAEVEELVVKFLGVRESDPRNRYGVSVDNRLYGIVIRAYATAGKPDRAQSLLETMIETGVRPDAKSVLDVILAWTDAPLLSIPEKSAGVTSVLSKVSENVSHEEEDRVATNKTVASEVLRMLSSGMDDKNSARAELLFKTFLFFNQSEIPGFALGVEDYCAVIKALSRGGPSASPERAESVLMELIRQSDADPENESLKPTEHAFTSTITSWTKSKDDRAALRAQNIFDLMLNRYQKGQLTSPPSKHIYTALITTWLHANNPKNAEIVLNQMLNDYENGNDLAQPDVVAFNMVLSAWNYAGRVETNVDAYERSKAIFDLMTELNDEFPVAPNRKTYYHVISTLVSSRRPDKTILARSYLKQANEQSLKPDIPMLSASLQVYKSFFNDGQGTTDDLNAMLYYLDQIVNTHKFDDREAYAYWAHDAVLHALMKLSREHPEFVADHADSVIERFLHLADSSLKKSRRLAPKEALIFKMLVIFSRLEESGSTEQQRRIKLVRSAMQKHNIPMTEKLTQLFEEIGLN